MTTDNNGANKTDAGNGSKAVCRVSNVLRSPSPNLGRYGQKMNLRCPEFISLALSFLLLGCGGDVPDTSNDQVYYQGYKMEPVFLDSNDLKKEDSSEVFPEKDQTIHDFVSNLGIDFRAPNSGVITGLEFSGFGMRNTSRNHEILARALDERFPGKWSIVGGEDTTETPP